MVFGLGSGLFSIVNGTLPLMLFGSEGYGQLQGRVLAARLVVSAVAPFALAFAMEHWGVIWSLALTAVIGGGAIGTFLAIAPLAILASPGKA